MKKYKILFLCLAGVLFLISCKSTPEEESPAPVEEPQIQENSTTEKTTEEPKQEVAPVIPEDFTEVNATLFKKTENARDLAVAADAPSLLDHAWNQTETSYKKLQSDYTGELKTTDLSDRINDMTARYQALEKAALGYAAKTRVDKLGFAAIDKKDYSVGEAAYAAVIDLYESGASGSDLKAKAEEGCSAYQAVLKNGFRSLADAERNKALTQKKAADSVKAGVAEKDVYKKAADLFKYGDSQYVTQDLEGAYGSYQEASADFTTLYESVAEKRTEAQKFIDAAKAAVSSTENYASEADTIAPIGDEPVEGIESPDAELIEQGTYADPESAVIRLDENVQVTADAEGDAAK